MFYCSPCITQAHWVRHSSKSRSMAHISKEAVYWHWGQKIRSAGEITLIGRSLSVFAAAVWDLIRQQPFWFWREKCSGIHGYLKNKGCTTGVKGQQFRLKPMTLWFKKQILSASEFYSFISVIDFFCTSAFSFCYSIRLIQSYQHNPES